MVGAVLIISSPPHTHTRKVPSLHMVALPWANLSRSPSLPSKPVFGPRTQFVFIVIIVLLYPTQFYFQFSSANEKLFQNILSRESISFYVAQL